MWIFFRFPRILNISSSDPDIQCVLESEFPDLSQILQYYNCQMIQIINSVLHMSESYFLSSSGTSSPVLELDVQIWVFMSGISSLDLEFHLQYWNFLLSAFILESHVQLQLRAIFKCILQLTDIIDFLQSSLGLLFAFSFSQIFSRSEVLIFCSLFLMVSLCKSWWSWKSHLSMFPDPEWSAFSLVHTLIICLAIFFVFSWSRNMGRFSVSCQSSFQQEFSILEPDLCFKNALLHLVLDLIFAAIGFHKESEKIWSATLQI